jgi:hypothetical protein
MKNLATVLAIVAYVCSGGFAATSFTAASKLLTVQVPGPQTMSDSATVAGKWVLSVGRQEKRLELTVQGKKVTGHFVDGTGQPGDKLDGEFVDGRLKFSSKVEAIRRDGSDAGHMVLKYEGRLMKDGSLAGTISLAGFDEVKTWTAVRAK